jgi:tetratricopeptide (TPR) repeat protein
VGSRYSRRRAGGSRRRVRWFKLIALLLPVLLLVAVELLLRLFGYGHYTSLFIRYPDNPDYWVMNKYASERYFSDTVNETKGSIEPFRVEKTANTVRIFVLGESTTAGYPYFHNGAFHRWLQFRLMHEYPELHFEIVNLSLTAVNSYTVLDFGRQLVKYRPDAVLVYAGHNEYYGALGIGSTSHIANSRWLVQAILTLRKLRLVQWMGRLFSAIGRSGGSGSGADERENLMQRMAANQRIAYGSAAYTAGVEQFRYNMDELCRVMQKAGVPVFLSTVVANEKDQRPLGKGAGAAGGGAGATGVIGATADQEFALGDSAYAAGNYPLAKEHYVKAKEFDVLRFRAPEAMNEIIIKLTEKYPGVHLVDTKRLFEQHSPHGIIGNTTILEHVHPNLLGYALLSDAFYQAVEKAGLIKGGTAREMSFAELLSKMPVTGVDSLNGAYTIMMLKARWPWNEPIPAGFKRGNSVEAQLAGAIAVNRINWMDAMNELYRYSVRTTDKATALKAVGAIMLEKPDNTTYKLYAGRLSFELGEDSDALFYFRQAYDLDPSPANTQTMYLAYLKMDQPERALGYIDAAMALQPDNQQLPIVKSLVGQIIQLKGRLVALSGGRPAMAGRPLSPEGEKISRLIALDYHHAGADEAAAKYIERRFEPED